MLYAIDLPTAVAVKLGSGSLHNSRSKSCRSMAPWDLDGTKGKLRLVPGQVLRETRLPTAFRTGDTPVQEFFFINQPTLCSAVHKEAQGSLFFVSRG